MDTKWKNMVKAIKKFIKEYYDCVFGSLLFIIGSFLFFVVLVNRYYFSTWGVWRICLIGNILVQPGICLLVRRYMKLRYRNWSQKGIAETYLQDAEDSIYYQTWKAKEKQSEKRFRNILAVELSAAAAYLFFISYSSGWGWNYAAGYMMVATVFIEYICCREVIQRYWRNELDQIMEQTESFFQKRLEQALEIERKSLEKVSRSDQLRVDLITNVSHDLKTPLTSMKVLADSLIGQEDTPVELYREFMSDIGAEIDRENKIINDLLSLVKMDKAAGNINIESVNINELLERIMKRLKPIAQRQNVELVMESFRPVVAEVDEMKLTLALSNLIENGIKYNNAEGWVHVTLNADHQNFFVTVEDNGIGIPKEAQTRIFERFYRVDKSHSREIGGTGLGLAIARNAIIMHRGAIKVHSLEGEGTTFTVRIPLTYIAG